MSPPHNDQESLGSSPGEDVNSLEKSINLEDNREEQKSNKKLFLIFGTILALLASASLVLLYNSSQPPPCQALPGATSQINQINKNTDTLIHSPSSAEATKNINTVVANLNSLKNDIKGYSGNAGYQEMLKSINFYLSVVRGVSSLVGPNGPHAPPLPPTASSGQGSTMSETPVIALIPAIPQIQAAQSQMTKSIDGVVGSANCG